MLQILSNLPACTPVTTDIYGTGYCDLSADNDLTGSFYAAPANDANDVKLFAYGDTRNHADH